MSVSTPTAAVSTLTVAAAPPRPARVRWQSATLGAIIVAAWLVFSWALAALPALAANLLSTHGPSAICRSTTASTRSRS